MSKNKEFPGEKVYCDEDELDSFSMNPRKSRTFSKTKDRKHVRSFLKLLTETGNKLEDFDIEIEKD